MTNEIIKYESNGQEIRLTKEDVFGPITKGNKYITDGEVEMFMRTCQYQGLNPFLNEAYLVKYDPNKPASTIVGKEAFMKRAEKQPDYNGFKAGLILDRNGEIIEVEGSFKLQNDKLLGGWAKVYKKDREDPYTVAKVSMQEYSQSQATWKTKPNTMIRKVAIVQAIREAYPDEFGGMYIQEEQSNYEIEVVDDDKKKKPKKKLTKKVNKKTLPNRKTEDDSIETEYVEIEDIEDEAINNTNEIEKDEITPNKGEPEDTITETQAEIMFGYANGKGISNETVVDFMKENFDVSKARYLTEDEMLAIIDWVDNQ